MNSAAAVESLCIAVAKNDLKRARELVRLVLQPLAPARRTRVQNWLAQSDGVAVTPAGQHLKHWQLVTEKRAPWVPVAVERAIKRWLREVSAADALVEAGERVLPIVLAGETRCGKTSSLCGVANELGMQVYRLNLADVVGSHLGESAQFMRKAITEMKACQNGLWIIDEIDGVAPKRRGSQGAEQERAHAVGSLLAELDSLPPSVPLCATTNLLKTMDSAVLGRFQIVEFPAWADLDTSDRLAFATSHGHAGSAGSAATAASYADVVKAARDVRVEAILQAAAAHEAEDPEDAEFNGPDPDDRPSETKEQRELWLSELREKRSTEKTT